MSHSSESSVSDLPCECQLVESFFVAVRCRCGSASDTSRPMFCCTRPSELKISRREPRDMGKVSTPPKGCVQDEFLNPVYIYRTRLINFSNLLRTQSNNVFYGKQRKY